ncbi:hypothetical protein [Rothia nasimurium]|uniref:hypothetical protein n=1 Tax=Rothia nasimurium TaxID=85336 RepID=UPI001F3EED06|nr:hypothetical protein [Rothia nasimurium]
MLDVEEISDEDALLENYFPWNVGLTNEPSYATPYTPDLSENFSYEVKDSGISLSWDPNNISPGRVDRKSFIHRILQLESAAGDNVTVSWKIYADNLSSPLEGNTAVSVLRINNVQELYAAVAESKRLNPASNKS